jgi:hypothetical protein
VSPRRISIVALFVCALLAGCGGGDSSSDEKAPPAAKTADFPKPGGKSLVDLLNQVGGNGPVLAPSGLELRTGRHRFGFALFSRSREQISNASVAIYTAQIPFDKPGRYELLGIARLGGKLVPATMPTPGVVVKKESGDAIPAVGTRPPRIHTPTVAEVGGDVASIDTRLPPSSMHDADFADVLGKKPVVLLFATPQLCQSRVCGPVVDVAEQVKASSGDDVEFIHMEIYRDNRIDKGPRPQMLAFHLQSEPWLFVFDRSGKVSTRIEGAFSERELQQAISKATG